MSGSLADGVKGKLVGSSDREWKWTSLSYAETPDVALNSQGHADAYLQIYLASGTPTMSLEGTDLEDANGVPTQFEPVLDATGTAIAATADGRVQLQNLPKWFRPTLSTTGVATFIVKGRGAGV